MHKAASKKLFDSQVNFPEALLRLRNWKVNQTEYPVLDVTFRDERGRSFRVRLVCDDWDDQPPSIEFLSPEGELLRSITRDPAGIFNEGPHPNTGRPFVCTIGAREYHTHSSHLNDYWTNYKGRPGFDLGGILTKLWRAWKTIP